MPTWICNHLTIEGRNAAKIMRSLLIESNESDSGFDVDFNKIRPVPKELSVAERATARDYASLYINALPQDSNEYKQQAALYRQAFDAPLSMSVQTQTQEIKFALLHLDYASRLPRFATAIDVYTCGRQALNNYVRYGATNIEDWCKENWGTQQNACHTQINDMNTADMYFDTESSEALAFIVALSQKYPKHIMHFEYAANIPGYTAGDLSFQNGIVVAGYPHADESREAYETYFSLWGGEDEYRFNINTGTYESIEEEMTL